MSEPLTRKQLAQREAKREAECEKVLPYLKALLAAPERKDILLSIPLGRSKERGCQYEYLTSYLVLDAEGLKTNGHVWCGRREEPSTELVKTYKLKAADLENLLQRLRA